MAEKGSKRSWNDIQLLMATASVTLTLTLWNLFAGPDREEAAIQVAEQAKLEALAVQAAPPVASSPGPTLTAAGGSKLLFGGAAPQTQVIVQSGRGGRGGGGGGGAATSTRSS